MRAKFIDTLDPNAPQPSIITGFFEIFSVPDNLSAIVLFKACIGTTFLIEQFSKFGEDLKSYNNRTAINSYSEKPPRTCIGRFTARTTKIFFSESILWDSWYLLEIFRIPC